MAEDRGSFYTERIVAALFIMETFVSVARFILPGCYPEGTKLHWLVPDGCSRCALLQSFPCHLLGQEETESSFDSLQFKGP